MLTMLDKALAYFLMTLMALMVVDVSWQVFTRYVLNSPSPFTEELARFLLIWIGLLGAAYAFRKKAHLGLDLMVQKMRPRARLKAEVLTNLLCFAFAANVMVYGGARLVLLMLELGQTSAALRVPMGYVYLVLPLSGTLIGVYALDNARQSIRQLRELTDAS